MNNLPNIDWQSYNVAIPPELKLPRKFKSWRTDQQETVDEIVSSGKPTFLLDAPTGSGKSLTSMAAYRRLMVMDEVMDRMTGDYNRYRCIYLTRTIQLQEQVLKDFPEGMMVKGRSNYPCEKRAADFPGFTAADCPGDSGRDCPYLLDKKRAAQSPLAVLNDAYYLTEVNGPGQFRGANLVVVDEIDSLESCLMDSIQFTVSERQCKKYGLQPPERMDLITEWQSWAEQAYRRVSETLNNMERQMPMDIDRWTDIEIDINREIKRGHSFLNKMKVFAYEVNDTWILDLEEGKDWKVAFKPVTVGPYCEKYMWQHGHRFLGMSGTILDPEILADDLGIENYAYRRLGSHFPVENRPIFYQPVVNLRHKTMATELPKLVPAITALVTRHIGENVLIHTTSNYIRDYLVDNLPFTDQVMTHDTRNRATQLEVFKKSRGRVMVSPSFDRGVNLFGDECRCVIIVKIPYLNLNDKQVRARLAMPRGQRWYNLRAIQTVMQMAGRAVRSEDDHAVTYILDKQFDSLLARTRHLLPEWWLEALRREM